jgi:3',5'-cyclic AMP phosphodiesterase CpdA
MMAGLSGCSRKQEDVRVSASTEADENTAESIAGETTEAETESESESETQAPESSEPETSEASTINPFPEQETAETTRPDYAKEDEGDWDHQIFLGTDIHYLSRELTDGGEYFQYMVEHGDGKVVTYVEQITDAFLETVIDRHPDVLILSGDLTLDGEKKSHEELAEKLYTVEEAGIPVLVIPGNHDINNRHAAAYIGNDRRPAEYTTPEEFREIYRDFGYDEAESEDRTSLSYTFDLDPSTRFLMIDSCIYQPRARVGGAISDETYNWIEEQLEDAWDKGMNVIPVAHHNLLNESEIEEYVIDCTIEHGEQFAEMLDEWDVSVFLSGHLHVQHAKRSGANRGVWEVVTSSLSTPACQYGVLNFRDNGDFAYHTDEVDVQSWALRNERSENDLLGFDAFKEPFLRRVFYNQAYDKLKTMPELTETQRVRMSELYSELNYHYYQGDAYQFREKIEASPSYSLWLEEGGGTQLSDYLQFILEDAEMDYNHVTGL